MASAASDEKLQYDVKNFKTYFAKLKAKCMTSADAAQVLLGIFSDPIRELKALSSPRGGARLIGSGTRCSVLSLPHELL